MAPVLIFSVSLHSSGRINTISPPIGAILKLQLRTYALFILFLAILEQARLLHIHRHVSSRHAYLALEHC
jgi:hypothetical protein